MDNEELEEIDELISWNLSFGVSVYETLFGIGRLDLLEYFENMEIILEEIELLDDEGYETESDIEGEYEEINLNIIL